MLKEYPIMLPWFDENETREIAEALASGWVAQGPRVARFERLVAAHEGVAHAAAATSCTTALHVALTAMGIGPGHDVLLPSFTFVATANAVSCTGAVPVLCDIDAATFNIDCGHAERVIRAGYVQDPETGRWKNRSTGSVLEALIPVHLFGLCADMPAVTRLADTFGMKILEDGACGMGAMLNGRHPGAFGNPCALSFHPRKSITTGEGGMVLSNDEAFIARVRSLRSHAATVSEVQRHQVGGFLLPDYDEVGFNYRMTDVQAAMGIAQMAKFDTILERKQRLAACYSDALGAVPALIPPTVPDGCFHAWQSYVCMVDAAAIGIPDVEAAHQWRNRLMSALEARGIHTRQGTHAVHLLGVSRSRDGLAPEDLPNAWRADRLSIALPMFMQMDEEDVRFVVQAIGQVIEGMRG